MPNFVTSQKRITHRIQADGFAGIQSEASSYANQQLLPKLGYKKLSESEKFVANDAQLWRKHLAGMNIFGPTEVLSFFRTKQSLSNFSFYTLIRDLPSPRLTRTSFCIGNHCTLYYANAYR